MGLLLRKIPTEQNDEAFNQGPKETVHWCQKDFEGFSETRLCSGTKNSTLQLFLQVLGWV